MMLIHFTGSQYNIELTLMDFLVHTHILLNKITTKELSIRDFLCLQLIVIVNSDLNFESMKPFQVHQKITFLNDEKDNENWWVRLPAEPVQNKDWRPRWRPRRPRVQTFQLPRTPTSRDLRRIQRGKPNPGCFCKMLLVLFNSLAHLLFTENVLAIMLKLVST